MYRKIVSINAWICLTIVLSLTLSACGDSGGSSVSSTPTNVPVNTQVTLAVTPTPELTSPTILVPPPTAESEFSYQSIVEKQKSLSGSQRRQYLDSLKGQQVSDWYGWAEVARKQITTGKWELKLDLDDPDPTSSSWDVRIIIPESQALQFTEGQAVTFSGTISEVSCGSSDCDVDLENVSFGSPQVGSPQLPTSAPPSPTSISNPVPPTSESPLPQGTPIPPTSISIPSLPTDTPQPLPTAIPPTNIPEQTATPEPSPTPVPTATPQTPEGILREAIARRGVIGDLTNVQYLGTSVNITYAIQASLTDNLTRVSAQHDLASIVRAVSEAGIKNYTQVWVRGTFPMQDVYGKVTDDAVVVNVTFDRATVERIDWDNFFDENIYEVADVAKIHPEFQPK